MSEKRPSNQSHQPHRPVFQLASLFTMNAPRGLRWPFALRAAAAMGFPLATGWAVGDFAAGLTASIGGFAAVYGTDRPFYNRAIFLGGIVASFAFAVMIGKAAADIPLLVIIAVASVATFSAFFCAALKVPPPGAYLFTLAVAAGSAMGPQHSAVWEAGSLVLAGGAFAWILSMVGVLFAPYGPELVALNAAATSVQAFLLTVGTASADAARHKAALALHTAWTVLVVQQPKTSTGKVISRSRSEMRQLHTIFAETINAAAEGKSASQQNIERVVAIADQANRSSGTTGSDLWPLGQIGRWRALTDNARPGAPAYEVAVRVAIASMFSGMVGWATEIESAYWITAAAVLMLYQGLSMATMLQRAIQRVGGTFVGTLLAAAILSLQLNGLALALAIALLQFCLEMFVVRNYGLAVIFITAVALIMISGVHPIANVSEHVWIRAQDTVLGCAIGVVVYALLVKRDPTPEISHELLRTWAAVDMAASYLARGDVQSEGVKRARQNLQHHAISLLEAFESAIGSGRANCVSAESLWPAVAASQGLAYRLLATGWTIETAAETGENVERAKLLFGEHGAIELHRALASFTGAVTSGSSPKGTPAVPQFLQAEIEFLRGSLPRSERLR